MNEHVQRSVKAEKLALAMAHLAAPATDVPATAAEVYAFAQHADDATWRQAEQLAGTRKASDTTRAVTLALLARVKAYGAYTDPEPPTDPLEGLPR